MSWVWIDTYFASTDSTCSQPSIGNVTRSNTNSVTIDGTTLVGANTVDKVTATAAAPFPGLSAGASGLITINNISFGNSYNQSSTAKTLFFVTGTTLSLGGGAPLDASGYPTTLSPAPAVTFTKL